jgi:hypothetical protein
MLIFGTRTISRLVPNGMRITRFCGRCATSSELVEHRTRRYFTLYFIPVLPLDKADTVLTCSRCQASYYPTTEDYLHQVHRRSAVTERAIINCPFCSQPARIPVRPGRRLNVICPHCSEKFGVEAGGPTTLDDTNQQPTLARPASVKWRNPRRIIPPLIVLAALLIVGLVEVLKHRPNKTASPDVIGSIAPPASPTGTTSRVPIPAAPSAALPSQTDKDALACPDNQIFRPRSGAELGGRYHGGLGKLHVVNGTDLDSVAVLIDDATGGPRRAIFIRSRESGSMTSVPPGRYHLRFQVGSDWLPERRFCWLRGTSEFYSAFDFGEIESERGTQYKTYEVTLHPVPQGTARTHVVADSRFELPPL